ncbi:WD40 repeat-like protein [Hesseltinella vesiculosa]|uniref:WD40 repeat-like protein n=1 Tax=Hesseltinella vesiculosa TaxID=101127 RepID=A0A1X2GW63_9FUNG|nr:WD40 repeat-like protein [Hesseltinella vesiculosa]
MEKKGDGVIHLNQIVHVQCEIRCILYSARFFGTSLANLQLASGTVFNQVHLWNIKDRNDQGLGIVTRELVGHEGVIFGVRFSHDGCTLASVSDDRTIRIWDLAQPASSPRVIFGHDARIWDAQFSGKYVVSISEDTTCRVWYVQKDVDDDNNHDSDCVACWDAHAGKNVWSCAISPDNGVVATGGQDSGIRLWSLTSINDKNIDSDDDLVTVRLPDGMEHEELRNFALLGTNSLISSALTGHFLKFDRDQSSNNMTGTELFQDPDFRGYCALQHSSCGQLVVAGSMHGAMYLYSPHQAFTSVKVPAAHEQKIIEIAIHNSHAHANLYYVVTFAFGEIFFHIFDASTPDQPVFKTLYQLMGPPERTLILSTAIVESQALLICGSRESALLLYRLPKFHSDSPLHRQPIFPTLQLRRSHGKQSISSVLVKPSTLAIQQNSDEADANGDAVTFWTAGRDGCYIEYRLQFLDHQPVYPTSATECVTGVAIRGETTTRSNDLLLEKVYHNKVTRGWLEGIVYVDDQLLLLGFYRKSFFVYNNTKRVELISIACGGAHRRWHFHTKDANLDHAVFAFIRRQQIFAYISEGSQSKDQFKESIMQQGYHGRETRALQYFDNTQDGPEAPLLFATAGEDTLLRIHQYIPEESRYVTHSVLRKHTSVVKCLEWSKGNETLLFSAGGKEQFRCWKLELLKQPSSNTISGINCLEWATCPIVGDKRTETRIMDLTSLVYDTKKGIHLIGAVYSDAMIRIWTFNEISRKFALVVDGTWHSKCILQIDRCVIPGNPGEQDRVLFFTSATDGRVAIWDINDDLHSVLTTMDVEVDPTNPSLKLTEPKHSFQSHMNGVNALQVTPWDERTLLVATGGEDNCVAVTLIDALTAAVVDGPVLVPGAHASSVTGLHILNPSTSTLPNTRQVATVAIDQRLNIWQVTKNPDQPLQLKLINAAFADVPDPSTFDCLQRGDVTYMAITGIGLQSFKYKSAP